MQRPQNHLKNVVFWGSWKKTLPTRGRKGVFDQGIAGFLLAPTWAEEIALACSKRSTSPPIQHAPSRRCSWGAWVENVCPAAERLPRDRRGYSLLLFRHFSHLQQNLEECVTRRRVQAAAFFFFFQYSWLASSDLCAFPSSRLHKHFSISNPGTTASSPVPPPFAPQPQLLSCKSTSVGSLAPK